ncbi:hypothetical protein BZG36_03774 [Bifiguratus adelaidae]|uniref:Kinesin motor domain-containing protein n=1 Tax=Bifiguratus adelaidae TaxID=1938954 RepID=A0A261XXU8_9FUNG|nr:hypothetical protein BZG36_03774 [Bifiguratus adelaidae]
MADPRSIPVQVLVRCRGLLANEKSEKPPLAVIVPDVRGREVYIRPTQHPSSFEQVFGPSSRQEDVFQVVCPLIQDVLLGYSCTVIAYGQTGTGKTYTMQGALPEDLQSSASSPKDSRDFGIAPRSLQHLFDILEANGLEYSVIMSQIEIYNEELKDLLSSDTEKRLKIYDDAATKSRSGVSIQNCEEIVLQNAAHGIALLSTGAARRKEAATNLNDASSRSHCIITLTVHTKETTSEGEDLLKIGRLMLVDMAGSEDINRSTSDPKRVREAGIINQSLLTFGRVINALVERATHVPYREGKLTRLLQDSLGGRHKTCIIATISQTRANIDETINTLECATKAKGIRNTPELNHKMTKKALMREYANEIARLKSDLTNNLDATTTKLGQTLTEFAKARAKLREEKVVSVYHAHVDNYLDKVATELLQDLEDCMGEITLLASAMDTRRDIYSDKVSNMRRWCEQADNKLKEFDRNFSVKQQELTEHQMSAASVNDEFFQALSKLIRTISSEFAISIDDLQKQVNEMEKSQDDAQKQHKGQYELAVSQLTSTADVVDKGAQESRLQIEEFDQTIRGEVRVIQEQLNSRCQSWNEQADAVTKNVLSHRDGTDATLDNQVSIVSDKVDEMQKTQLSTLRQRIGSFRKDITRTLSARVSEAKRELLSYLQEFRVSQDSVLDKLHSSIATSNEEMSRRIDLLQQGQEQAFDNMSCIADNAERTVVESNNLVKSSKEQQEKAEKLHEKRQEEVLRHGRNQVQDGLSAMAENYKNGVSKLLQHSVADTELLAKSSQEHYTKAMATNKRMLHHLQSSNEALSAQERKVFEPLQETENNIKRTRPSQKRAFDELKRNHQHALETVQATKLEEYEMTGTSPKRRKYWDESDQNA